jgi:hypothetical protein
MGDAIPLNSTGQTCEERQQQTVVAICMVKISVSFRTKSNEAIAYALGIRGEQQIRCEGQAKNRAEIESPRKLRGDISSQDLRTQRQSVSQSSAQETRRRDCLNIHVQWSLPLAAYFALSDARL